MSLPQIRRDVVLAPFTTFGIGGSADYFCTPQNADELTAAFRWGRAAAHPTFVLGLGANVLVGDKGFRGLVIKNESAHYRFAEERLTAESGSVIGTLIELTADKGLSGLEHYQDIPSTLGGAMWQNLHFLSYPHDRTHFIAEIVIGATVLAGDTITKVDRDYFQFGYDDSSLHRSDDIVLDVTLKFSQVSKEEIAIRRAKNAEWRAAKHPPGAVKMSAGSIFRKIEGVGAGRLIDAAGLKGHRLGGAEVSAHHANYILNTSRATATDVRALIGNVQVRVKETSGYELLPEISFIGEF